jgi:hypothetical protein
LAGQGELKQVTSLGLQAFSCGEDRPLPQVAYFFSGTQVVLALS